MGFEDMTHSRAIGPAEPDQALIAVVELMEVTLLLFGRLTEDSKIMNRFFLMDHFNGVLFRYWRRRKCTFSLDD
jgi:hypothetical protein